MLLRRWRAELTQCLRKAPDDWELLYLDAWPGSCWRCFQLCAQANGASSCRRLPLHFGLSHSAQRRAAVGSAG